MTSLNSKWCWELPGRGLVCKREGGADDGKPTGTTASSPPATALNSNTPMRWELLPSGLRG
eukprot:15440245-Alexandrium_andersonii.AAC.1